MRMSSWQIGRFDIPSPVRRYKAFTVLSVNLSGSEIRESSVPLGSANAHGIRDATTRPDLRKCIVWSMQRIQQLPPAE